MRLNGVVLHDYDTVWASETAPYMGDVPVLSFKSGSWAEHLEQNGFGTVPGTGYKSLNMMERSSLKARYPRSLRVNVPDLGYSIMSLSDAPYFLGGYNTDSAPYMHAKAKPITTSKFLQLQAQGANSGSIITSGGAGVVSNEKGNLRKQDASPAATPPSATVSGTREAISSLTHIFLGARVAKEKVVALEFQLAANNEKQAKKDAKKKMVQLLKWEDG